MEIKSSGYIGGELELFQHAGNWKEYYGNLIKKYIHGNVLEVGAGIGGTTKHLTDMSFGKIKKWICLEPDPLLLSKVQEMCKNNTLPDFCSCREGYSSELLSESILFDTILYMDVIEHIQNDKKELETAYRLLNKGGYLIILVPAHNYLFSPFDKAIGHFRRYNKKLLLDALPSGIENKELKYLDSVGYFASLGNSVFLKQSYPTLKQIKFWDNYLVSLSRLGVDKLSFFNFGKSLLFVGKKL